MNELQELLNRAFVDEDTGAYNELSRKLGELQDAYDRLGQALRVARQYKARMERCEALAREGK